MFIIDSALKLERVVNLLRRLPIDGHMWDVSVKLWKPRRTLEQNARLHLLFQHVANSTGGDIESVKLGYKAMFLAGKETAFGGRKIMVYPKTSKMNRKDLADFMTACESHAISEFGVFLGDSQ